MNEQNLKKITELRHELHRHPNLSMQEGETKEILKQFIKENTELEIVDKGLWFYAASRAEFSDHSERNPIGFRADFDALPIEDDIEAEYRSCYPGLAHKCGHDGHSAILAGLALELDQRMKREHERMPKVYLIFQHAEETGEGGEECAAFIKEAGIGQVFAFHNRPGYPEGTMIYRHGLTQCASKGLTIYFEGKPSHASAPEDGRNPAFAIAKLIDRIEHIKDFMTFEEMVLCTIVGVTVGDQDFGISAGDGELAVTLRANIEAEMEALEEHLLLYAEELAEEYGLEAGYAIADPFPETRNHESAIGLAIEAAEELGIRTMELEQPWRASEDFGYYTKVTEGAMLYLGTGEDAAPLHTVHYDFNDKVLATGVDLFAGILERYLARGI